MIGGGVAGLSTARALVELGLTDVLVLERDTVGSGGSGKSSGIVRCHYGIPSLAAMAWRALPVLEHADRDPRRALGLHQDRLPGRRRPGEPRGAAGQRRHAAGPRHRCRADGPRRGARPVARGPARRLRRVRLRAQRRLRRRPPDGAGLRGGRPPRRRPPAPARAGGLGRDRRRSRHRRRPGGRQPHRGRPRRAGGRALVRHPGRRPRPSTCPCGPSGRRSSWWTRAGRPDRSPSSPTWCRSSTCAPRAAGRSCSATPTTPTPSGPTPTPTASGSTTTSWPTPCPSSPTASPASTVRRSPRPTPAVTTSPPTTTRSSRPRRSQGVWLCTGFSGHGYKISPSVGKLMADLITARREPPRRRRPARLPLGALRRGRPTGQPAPLRGRGPDALTAPGHVAVHRRHAAPPTPRTWGVE